MDPVDLYVVGGWVLRVVMIPVVAYRRRLVSALGWLAMVFLFPWVGVLLYVVLAERRTTRRVRRHEAVVRRSRTPERLAFEAAYPGGSAADAEPARVVSRLSRRLGGFGVVGGNAVEILEARGSAIDRLVDDIARAEDRVDLLFYIIGVGSTARRVTRALRDAAARGVSCRVLADAMGSRRFHRTLAPSLRDAGVEVTKVLPVGLLLKRLRPLDLRNHRKLAVIDGSIGYVGSMNLADEDVEAGSEEAPWRDVLARIRGPAARHLQLVFAEDWRYNTGEDVVEGTGGASPAPTSGRVAVQVVPSGPGLHVGSLHSLLVAAINEARERIVVTSPYFIPDEPTRVALRLAVLRGVRVDLVIPSVSDSRFVTAASRSYYGEVLREGVRIHEHRSGFLHAKTVTVDSDLAVVGSANFDRRSFHLNFELSLLLYGPEAVDRLKALQKGYLARSRELDPEAWEARPVWRKVAQDVARLVSPLL